MNRKQKICLWIGIITVCLSNLVALFFGLLEGLYFSNVCSWFIWVFGIALITGGLIVTFADKKDKKPKDEQKE